MGKNGNNIFIYSLVGCTYENFVEYIPSQIEIIQCFSYYSFIDGFCIYPMNNFVIELLCGM